MVNINYFILKINVYKKFSKNTRKKSSTNMGPSPERSPKLVQNVLKQDKIIQSGKEFFYYRKNHKN